MLVSGRVSRVEICVVVVVFCFLVFVWIFVCFVKGEVSIDIKIPRVVVI